MTDPHVVKPNRPRSRWLLRQPLGDAPARIFCFPYAGTGASMYAKWPRQIGPAEVCLLQPPGRENRLREPHYLTYDSFVDELVPVLLPYLDRPFAFFGHCGGATPAFATAKRLAEQGLPIPSNLFVSSQVAPDAGPYSRFLHMTDAELASELAKLSRAMGGEPTPALIEMGLKILRADLDAYQRYPPVAPVLLPCHITVLRWSDDGEIPAGLQDGWRHYTAAERIRFATLQGGHFSFLT